MDLDSYWEREYQEFEEEYFHCDHYWRAPAHALRDTFLFPVFERFTQSFPDHTGDRNTVFYLTESQYSPARRSVVLTNSHFEHQPNDDLVELVSFIEYASGVLIEGDIVFVDRLDGIREDIILTFRHPLKEVVTLFQQFPQRTKALP